jgi:uncharacterized membrane protein YqaE (UPF0057 family)
MRKNLCLLLAVLCLNLSVETSFASVIIPATNTSSEPSPVVVKSAMDAFHGLSKKERKAKIKDVRKEIKAFNAAKKAGNEPSTNTLLLAILAILLPPLAVYLYEGEITTHFWISLLLTLLFWLPGIIYALIIIFGNK